MNYFKNNLQFNGSLSSNCQQEAVPAGVTAVIDRGLNMILSGPGNASCDNKAAVSISALIIFNAVQQTSYRASGFEHGRFTISKTKHEWRDRQR